MNINVRNFTELLCNLRPYMVEGFLEDYSKRFEQNPQIFKDLETYITSESKKTRIKKYFKIRSLLADYNKMFERIDSCSMVAKKDLMKNFYTFFKTYEYEYSKDYRYYLKQISQLQRKGIDQLIITSCFNNPNCNVFNFYENGKIKNHLKLYTDAAIKRAKVYREKGESSLIEGCILDLESPSYMLYRYPVDSLYKPISSLLKTTEIDFDPSILPEREELSQRQIDFNNDIFETLSAEDHYQINDCPELENQKVKTLYKKID